MDQWMDAWMDACMCVYMYCMYVCMYVRLFRIRVAKTLFSNNESHIPYICDIWLYKQPSQVIGL